MSDPTRMLEGAGLGLRRALTGALAEAHPANIGFLEVTPENWMGLGGRYARDLAFFAEQWPLASHGLSLSLGGPDPLDEAFIGELKAFLDTNGVVLYSEHLSYCTDGGHLYDLMPLPFTEEAVHHLAGRIRRTQAILERRIAVENVSYYADQSGDMDEAAFVTAVLEEADCDLLLDVNNAYVNSVNHGYDPVRFIHSLPAERIAYMHVAGHYRESERLIIDTHGAAVVDPVWSLLETAYRHAGVRPTLLERDFNLPSLSELLDELGTIRRLQNEEGHDERRIA
ncbi:HvfB family MNIO-type RiPP peptide maturase [Thiohalomonas denitrificans]|uniref:UPF0276 protein SAMN03097708_01381 n=1 Tax=Thiohalomonas denitrificans TaxID=415747 RepID=A0A1G5Q692_9GAMM|nr:DUF692 domain-containing protein [Thiohalomonas denitrificans]SCZ57187.1 hypothetical protein SAMN03097708_01381 [Thiohalomonas denitrificans]